MRFAIKNHFNINGGVNCGSKGTTGKNLFGKLFGSKEEPKDSKIESLDDQHGVANIEIDGEIEASLDISADELKELAQYMKNDQEISKDSWKFFYDGLKKFVNDLAVGLETKGKEIVNAFHDVNDEFAKREHQAKLQHIKDMQECDDLREELGKKSK